MCFVLRSLLLSDFNLMESKNARSVSVIQRRTCFFSRYGV